MDAIPHVLLDTDIGTDPDDAFCLLYLLRAAFPAPPVAPRLKLLGITTVSGDSHHRAEIASAMVLQEAARHEARAARGEGSAREYHARAAAELKALPIVAGGSRPVRDPPLQPHAQQFIALRGLPHADFAPPDPDTPAAAEFLADTIDAHPPDTVTLMTIGPLTNVHHLVVRRPAAFARLKDTASMCGLFFERLQSNFRGVRNGLTEWNVLCDPHAAATFCAAARPGFYVGLDVTRKVTMPRDKARAMFAAAREKLPHDGALTLLSKLVEPWFALGIGEGVTDRVTFHDPLAAVALLAGAEGRKRLFPDRDGEKGTETGLVLVETEGLAKGLMVLRLPGREGNPPLVHEAARNVDAGAFFDEYWGTVLGDAKSIWNEVMGK